MSWLLPVALLVFAGIVALLPPAVLMRRPTSAPRLVFNATNCADGYACLNGRCDRTGCVCSCPPPP